MVGTVSAARHDGRRAFALTAAAFALGLALGASVVFVGLGLLGAWTHTRALVIVAVVVAVAAIACDAAGLRVRPQIRFQVPERWRRTMPLPRALFLYGILLGTGLTTYVPAAAAWALPALSLALGDVTGSLAIALGFAAGRALPVLVLAARGEETVLAERPQGLRVLRLLTAASLLLALVAGEVRAATTVASPGADATVVGYRSRLAAPGRGRLPLAQRRRHPAARERSRDRRRSRRLARRPAGHRRRARHLGAGAPADAARVQKLAVNDRWLVWRAGLQIRVQPLSDPTRSALVVRPSAWRSSAGPRSTATSSPIHRASAASSWLSAVDVATGKRRRLRFARDALLLNPSLLGAEPSLCARVALPARAEAWAARQ